MSLSPWVPPSTLGVGAAGRDEVETVCAAGSGCDTTPVAESSESPVHAPIVINTHAAAGTAA